MARVRYLESYHSERSESTIPHTNIKEIYFLRRFLKREKYERIERI